MSLQKAIFFHNNLLKKYTPTVTSEDADYPKENLYDDWLQSLYKPTGSGNLNVTINAGAAVEVDIFCLGNVHNLNSAGATVALQYSSTGAWTGEESDAFTPFAPSADNAYEYKLFTQVSAQYWRMRLTGMSSIPQIGEAGFGPRYTSPYYLSSGQDRERHIEGTTNLSGGGQKESIVHYRRNVFPCRLADIQVGSQDETDFLAFRDAVEDGIPFWFLRDIRGTYEQYFVSMAERVHKGPISDLGYRDFAFTLEEEV